LTFSNPNRSRQRSVEHVTVAFPPSHHFFTSLFPWLLPPIYASSPSPTAYTVAPSLLEHGRRLPPYKTSPLSHYITASTLRCITRAFNSTIENSLTDPTRPNRPSEKVRTADRNAAILHTTFSCLSNPAYHFLDWPTHQRYQQLSPAIVSSIAVRKLSRHLIPFSMRN
jgi:hypothetical protein